MERLKLTAAEVQSGDGSREGVLTTTISSLCYVNARYGRLFPCRLLILGQSHACVLSGREGVKQGVLLCDMLRQ